METFIGMDWATEADKSVLSGLVFGTSFVCELPRNIGNVTKLEQVSGRLIAYTDSGVDFIVPNAGTYFKVR